MKYDIRFFGSATFFFQKMLILVYTVYMYKSKCIIKQKQRPRLHCMDQNW